MENPIDELPTEQMREAARKIAALMDPLTPAETVALIRSYGDVTNDDQIKALAAAFADAHISDAKRGETMRTLSEIIDAAKDGGPWPTHEECFWAMQALEQAWMMTQRKYHEQVLTPKNETLAKMLAENDFKMAKSCLGADPKTWLGPDRDYSKPENRKRRETSVKLFEKFSTKQQ